MNRASSANSYFLYYLSSLQTKTKSMKKDQSWTRGFHVTWTNGHNFCFFSCSETKFFKLLLHRWITWYPRFNHSDLPSLKTKCYKSIQFYFKLRDYLPIEFNAQYWNFGLICNYFRFSQIRSQLRIMLGCFQVFGYLILWVGCEHFSTHW